ncbi:MAG: hypothetical protein K1W01_03140 [Muribaculaceae bacterium]
MKWFGRLIRKIAYRKDYVAPVNTIGENETYNNINPIKRNMAKKTVITKVLDANAQDGIIEFPQNRTLYVDQFTDNAPNTDEEREGFKPKNLTEVFEHYQPSKEGVALETEEGGSVYEDFAFHQIKDFEDEQLIEQSALLSEKKAKIDAYNAIVRQLQKNKPLRNALKDSESRTSLLNVLKSLMAEIEAAE